MPDPVELLSLIAELSIGLAGFSGVVVAFAGSGRDVWRDDDRFRLLYIVFSSLTPLSYALFSLSLLSAGVAASLASQIVSLWLVVLFAAASLYFSRDSRRLGTDEQSQIDGVVAAVLVSIQVVSVALLIANIASMKAFWPPFAVVSAQLVFGGVVFFRLLLRR